MSFASLHFLIFILLYLFLINIFKKNWKFISIIFSLFFYSYWSLILCLLLVFSVLQTYTIGYLVYNNKNSKTYLITGVITSLIILFIFKYFNFFISDLANIDLKNTIFSKIILPIGISFYTFQSISYLIDIYKKKIKPTNLKNLFIFIIFFPQLVAGPIVRARKLIPQIERGIKINFNNYKKGLMLILWGYFLKLCVSNNLDAYVSSVYNFIGESNTPTLFVTAIFYSFLIYADFCGYSLIAIGILKMLGFNIPANFLTPYFSTNLTEFWRRWHISLSKFLRDYLYIPLGGNKNGFINTLRNIIIVMTIGGLWHGASLNFILWGFLHGIFLSIERIFNKININLNIPIIGIIYVFLLVTILWIPFSISNFNDLIVFINIFNLKDILNFSQIIEKFYVVQNLLLIFILIVLDMVFSKKNLVKIKNNYFLLGFTFIFILGLIITFGIFDEKKFIYFQF
jgi:D-alanyl-lipoteichoic acid acyltransferase DltB (MBOAT superfamily)